MASYASLIRMAEHENRIHRQLDSYGSVHYPRLWSQAGYSPPLFISSDSDDPNRFRLIVAQMQELPYVRNNAGLPVIILTNGNGAAETIQSMLSPDDQPPMSKVLPMSAYHLFSGLSANTVSMWAARCWEKVYSGSDASHVAPYCHALLTSMEVLFNIPPSFQGLLSALDPLSIDPEIMASNHSSLSGFSATLKQYSSLRAPLFQMLSSLRRSIGLQENTDNGFNLLRFADECMTNGACRAGIIPVFSPEAGDALAEELNDLLLRQIPFALIVDHLAFKDKFKDLLVKAQHSPNGYVSLLCSHGMFDGLDEELVARFSFRILSIGRHYQAVCEALKKYGEYPKRVVVRAGHRESWSIMPWERNDGWNMIQVPSDRLAPSDVRPGQIVLSGHDGTRIALCNRLVF